MEKQVYVNVRAAGETLRIFDILNKDETGVGMAEKFKNTFDKSYAEYLESTKELGASKAESIESYALKYVLIVVNFDGRKRKITEQDVLKSMESQGLAELVNENVFGGVYKPTDSLREILDAQHQTRMNMARNGEYVKV